MARDGHNEVDVTSPGITSGPPAKGGWVQNAFWRNGAWEVRSGFGQLGQWGTTLSAVRPGRATPLIEGFGLGKQVGCYVIDKTVFGHTQIISVWTAKSFTAKSPVRSRIQDVYVVFIYDVDTGNMWEEVVYQHTSQTSVEGSVYNADGDWYWTRLSATSFDMSKWKANYETSLDQDFQSWVSAGETDWWFAQYGNVVFMGAKGVPPLLYSPIDAWSNRSKQCTRALGKNLSPKYGESSSLTWAGPVPGAEVDVNPYVSASQYPDFSSAVTFGSHIAAARGREVLFSKAGQPFVFIADAIVVPDEVTTMAPVGNALLIFSKTKTFMYQPGGSSIASGQLTVLSDSIGCAGNGAACQMGRSGTTVAWIDSTGVHTTSGNFQINTISGPVDDFFSKFLENPLTSYFIKSGETSVSRNSQPKSISRFNPDGANLVYSPKLNVLLATFPEENVTLCFSEGRWSLWTTTTSATGATKASITENITKPFYGSSSQDLFIVGGIDSQFNPDESKNAGLYNVLAEYTSTSAYFLRYGRGGGIDRSIRHEDYRNGPLWQSAPYPNLETDLVGKTGLAGLILFDEPKEMPVGYEFFYSNNSPSHTVAADKKTVLVPIKASLADMVDGAGSTVYGVDEIHITFDFDNTHWEPVFLAGASTGQVYPIFPSERLSIFPGFDLNVSGTSEIKCYNTVGPTPDEDGSRIEIHLNTSTVAGTVAAADRWTHYPLVNLPANELTTLMYVPFVQKNADEANSLSGLGLSSVEFKYRNNAGAGGPSSLKTGNASVVNKGFLGASFKRKEDNVAQPVDWTVKSEAFGLQEGLLVQGRGVYILIENRGLALADNQLVSDNPSGFINLISAADGKEWVGQILDTSTANPTPALNSTVSKQSVLERVTSASGTKRALYGEAGVTYGDSGTPSTGTYICGSVEVDIIQISESQKGQSISWMLYGHIRARGQGLRVQSVKAEVTKAGERRRYGR